jgi:8-amino-7-oxononanoate synthase
MTSLITKETQERADLVARLKKEKMYTYFLEVSSPCANRMIVEGKECINFISNNYLGFSTHPKVLEAAQAALKKYGLGIGGSPLACGTSELHNRLKEKIAGVYKQEEAVLFTTGYQALLGSVQATVKKGDVSLIDSLVHRSIVDGVTLSGSDKRMWMHNDIGDLESLVDRVKNKYERMLVIVDSVYSMDGDIADLKELYRIKKEKGILILIDEAHSLGVLGKRGYGLPDHFDLPEAADLISGTFSKFAGAIGGFATGPGDFITYLKHAASPFVFSASLPPVLCAGVLKSFELLEEEPEWRQRLWDNVHFFIDGLKSIGFDTGRSKTPVVPIIIRDLEKTMLFNKKILSYGVYASPIVYPAVAPAESRIRLGVIATHTRDDLEKSLDVFKKAGKETGIL